MSSESAEDRLDERHDRGKVTFSEAAQKQYEKSYGIVGSHSGVQVCLWNKKALKGQAVCYKQKFYGIDCHRCAQMSPALAWCNEACVFCWRPMEWMKKTKFEENEVDEPDVIIEGTVKARRKLVSGFGGAGNDEKKFREAFGLFPSHWAISLSGEPTIYPRLGEMIRKLKANGEVKSIFVVTNGQEPERLEKMASENALPTQLYLSLAASNEEMFKKINRSVYADGWERLNRTLELIAGFPCRRVIRLTVIKGLNDLPQHVPEYAELIEKSRVDFVEVKSYMALGFSRKRLGVPYMAEHGYVKEFAGKLAGGLPNYAIAGEDEPSRIVLLKRKDSGYPNLINKKQL